MLYFHNEAARLTLHPAGQYVRMEWAAGTPPEDAVQLAMNHVIQALHTQGWQKVLIEQQATDAFSVERQAWAQLDWRPRAVHAGLRYGAFVQAHNVFTQMASLGILATPSGPWPHYHFCRSEPDAHAWLVAQPHVP